VHPSEQPVWLLDFDGVLNAVAAQGDTTVWRDWRRSPPDTPPENIPWFLWAPEAVTVVQDAVSAGVRVIWLTDWESGTTRIHETIAELPAGLEYLTRAARGPSRHWKANAAREAVPDAAPLLWTDDHLRARILREHSTKEWVAQRAGDTTVISPNKRVGVTPRDVRTIREWIAKVTR